jgi:hypothetical protein
VGIAAHAIAAAFPFPEAASKATGWIGAVLLDEEAADSVGVGREVHLVRREVGGESERRE